MFLVVVNMILINMMMAIINSAFEEIKASASDFKNKFELVEYVTRTGKEMIGIQLADPIITDYSKDYSKDGDLDENHDKKEQTCDDFSDKTDKLFDYIEKTYLDGELDPETVKYISKMNAGRSMELNDKKVAEYGFDVLFKEN